jgi:basic membrane protein A and related proteins
LKTRAVTNTLAAVIAAAAFGATAPAWAFKACQVTDLGGVDDKGFNQAAWKGVQDAQAQIKGVEGKLLESKAETDYVPNVNSFVAEKCDMIITIGFLLGDATKAAAEANPNIKFSIVDFAYDPVVPNILGEVYATDEAAFLAGYLAAGVSKSGVIGTFGGINIPPVTIFMDGLVRGVDYYNKQKGKSVKVLGWDPVKKEGLFTNNFDSLDDGKTFAKNLNDEGADIVMPVAGPVGQGSAALAAELGPDKLKIIGVDTDQYGTDPEHKGVFLTSILKRMDSTVVEAIKQAKDGTFKGGVIVGTLKSGGVGLAPLHDLDSAVPAELKSELEAISKGIMDGSISVKG